MKRIIVLVVLVVLALVGFVSADDQGLNDVHGSGMWRNSSDIEQVVTFVASSQSQTGLLAQSNRDGLNSIIVDIDFVQIFEDDDKDDDDTYACMSGLVTQATGNMTAFVGNRRWQLVIDGDRDYVRGSTPSPGNVAPTWCMSGDKDGNHRLFAGDVIIE